MPDESLMKLRRSRIPERFRASVLVCRQGLGPHQPTEVTCARILVSSFLLGPPDPHPFSRITTTADGESLSAAEIVTG
jgi:hypothetical protein